MLNIENQNNNPFELRLQSLSENIETNFRTIEFCKDLNEENTKKINAIFAQFLNTQEIQTA